jgi:hypothetical protein
MRSWTNHFNTSSISCKIVIERACETRSTPTQAVLTTFGSDDDYLRAVCAGFAYGGPTCRNLQAPPIIQSPRKHMLIDASVENCKTVSRTQQVSSHTIETATLSCYACTMVMYIWSDQRELTHIYAELDEFITRRAGVR